MIVMCISNKIGCLTKGKIYGVINENKEVDMYKINTDTNEEAWIDANNFTIINFTQNL